MPPGMPGFQTVARPAGRISTAADIAVPSPTPGEKIRGTKKIPGNRIYLKNLLLRLLIFNPPSLQDSLATGGDRLS
jgi:hypothetical protein